MNDTRFITRDGLKSAKKAARHVIEGFLEMVFFKEEVLKIYESHKDFRVGDNGTVLFGNRWGLFRGVYRVAKGYIAVHLGYLGEGLPDKELKHWKRYNINPSTIKISGRYFDFRSKIKRMIYFMNQSNKRIKNYIDNFFPDIGVEDKNIFLLDNIENVLNNLKKVINNKTTIDEFQSRIIFLNILLIESINVKLINKIFELISSDLRLSYVSVGLKESHKKFLRKEIPEQLKTYIKGTITPLKSLELLRKFLLFMRIHHDIIVARGVNTLTNLNRRRNKLYKDISKNFYSFYRYKTFGDDFPNKEYFKHYESTINNNTSFLKLLNKFRNHSSAHGFNSKEYKKILKKLKIDESENDFSKIYEVLISQVAYDLERIYFDLIIPHPPMKDHYTRYISDSLSKLHSSGNSYQSIFEDLISYLHDFPEFYPSIIGGVKKEYGGKKFDSKFIIELGSFIESLSTIVKDKTQKLVDYLIPGLKYEKALTIAHFSHIIMNSDKISCSFFRKIWPIISEGLKDKRILNVKYSSEHVISCLIEKCPKKLNKEGIKNLFKGEKINFNSIKKYIQ